MVEEYRGRRIVTNGKLFGIQGELITDCRYLSPTGARATIDSEVTIAAHRRHIDAQRRHFAEYIAREGQKSTFGCHCGWRGGYGQLRKKGDEVVFVSCPACSSDVIFMAVGDAAHEPLPPSAKKVAKNKPTGEKNKKDAPAGSARTAASHLPALDGDALRFTWGVERDGDDTYYVVKCGRTRVWRERANSGDRMRFYEVKRLLKRKYRARFVDLMATAAAAKHMLGRPTRSRLAPA